MIEVSNLNKSFDRVQALNNVCFKADNGHITCVLGPNGAGKTSLLRTLLGLMQRDSGIVRVDGLDPATSAQAVRASIGFLPDQVGLYHRLTAREYLMYFARLGGMSQPQAAERVAQVAALFEIGTLLDRRTLGFSQGERMRVSLARAPLSRPQNLILDEPTRGLDVMSTRALRKALLSLRAAGCCILLSTHIMQEVAQLSDHIIVMARGTVIAAGSQQQLQDASREQDLEDAFVSLVASAEMEYA